MPERPQGPIFRTKRDVALELAGRMRFALGTTRPARRCGNFNW